MSIADELKIYKEAYSALEQAYDGARAQVEALEKCRPRRMTEIEFLDRLQDLADRHECGDWFRIFREKYERGE